MKRFNHISTLFQDRHVKDSPGSALDREPEVDPSQDYQLLLGYENSTHTVLRFRRRLDTCDHHDIPITVSVELCMVFALQKFLPFGQIFENNKQEGSAYITRGVIYSTFDT